MVEDTYAVSTGPGCSSNLLPKASFCQCFYNTVLFLWGPLSLILTLFFFFFPIVCQKAWEPTPGDKEPEPDSSTWFRVYSFNQQCSAFLLWVLQSPPNPPPQLRYGGSEGLWRHVSPALENRGHSGCSPTGYNRASGQCSLSHFMSQYGSLKEDIATSLR